MLQHGVEVVDLDLEEAKDLLREFIERNPMSGAGTQAATRRSKHGSSPGHGDCEIAKPVDPEAPVSEKPEQMPTGRTVLLGPKHPKAKAE